MQIQVLDHGYVRFIEAWGHGDAGICHEYGIDAFDMECGIIEAARQSTQGSFRSWHPYELCEKCNAVKLLGHLIPVIPGDGTCSNGLHVWKEYKRGDLGLLTYLYNNKPPHATPFEFAGMVIEVQAPIFVFREWHRHRTQSYNEMSARYAPLPDLNYIPSVERIMQNIDEKNKQAGAIAGAAPVTRESAEIFRAELTELYALQETFYQRSLAAGIPKELARIDLPVGRYSRMRASTCLRNWLAFLTLRSDPGAQWEIRQFADTVGMIIAKIFPCTWTLFCAK